jgi:K+-transporting ATPase A subunit
MVKTITNKDVRHIYDKVNKRFTTVNMGTYFIINEVERNETTSYTYNSNFVYLNYCKMIRIEYILLIKESMHYFNWRRVGFENATAREKYLNKIIDKVIEYGCGYKRKY